MFTLLLLHAYSELKVSNINVVMPFKLPNHDPPAYNITAYHSRVTWSISNDKLIKIRPNPVRNGESSVEIQVLYEGKTSENVLLVASSRDGEVTINIIIDEVKRVRIETNIQVLYANISFDEYNLRGYDKSGNTFSTLDNYDVEWKYNTTEVRRANITETDLVLPDGRDPPQSQIIIQGLLAGHSLLGAVLEGGVVADDIKLLIVDPIYLLPKEKTLLPNVDFELTLCRKHASVLPSEECDRIFLPKEKYAFSSNDERIGTVNNRGIIHSVSVGLTQIQVTDTRFHFNKGFMTLKVVNPARIMIPEQWIIIGDVPSTKDAVFYDAIGNVLEKPAHIDWQLTEEYKQLGDHYVTATAFSTSTRFLVHVYERPRFDPNTVVLPVHHNGYYPNLLYGSGEFEWASTNPDILTLERKSDRKHRVITTKTGKVQVIAHDKRLNVDAILDVSVEKMINPRFIFERTEFIPDEEIEYKFEVQSESGRKFTYMDPYTVNSQNDTVVRSNNNKLTSAGAGFTNVDCRLTDYEQSVLIGVYYPLTVNSIVTFTTTIQEETPDIGRRNGPQTWPGAEAPTSVLKCGGVNVELIEGTLLKLSNSYKGICTLFVTNKKTQLNPNPRPDQVEFQVSALKIASLAISVTDKLSKNDPESGLVKSEYDPTSEIFALQNGHVKIPEVHKPTVTVYAYDENRELIGPYTHKHMKIMTSEDQEYDPYQYLKTTTTFTVIPPPALFVHKTSITVEPVPDIDVTGLDEKGMIFVNKNSKTGAILTVSGGTGHYVIDGKDATIDGDKLTIMPSTELERDIIVKDKYIDEYKKTIHANTEVPERLVILGPSVAIVRTTVQFKHEVWSTFGHKLSTEGEEFTTKTSGLEKIPGTSDEWSITPQEEGRVWIIVEGMGLYASRPLEVLNQIKFEPDNVILYPGETFVPQLIGGGVGDKIIYASTNDSCANMNKGILGAINPGRCKITAIIKDKPFLGVANLTVRVLEIRGIRIERFPETPYVDSIIHLKPVLETDIGDQAPRVVSWNVIGSNQWEKLYDNSVIIRADRHGFVNATISCHGFNSTADIYVDPKLELTTPNKISLPVGIRYNISVNNEFKVDDHGIPKHNKTAVEFKSMCSDSSLKVLPNGTIFSDKPGRYIVAAQYKSQWVVTQVTVSGPAELYLQSDAASVKPIPLDIDGQEYTTYEGAKVTFNITNEAIVNNGRYAFSVDDPVYVNFDVANHVFKVSNTTMVSHTSMFPTAPVVIKGVTTEFKCAAKRPKWTSSNRQVAPITDTGIVKANRRGRAMIHCSPDISTPITVIELNQISLIERDPMKMYSIDAIYSGGISSQSGLDISYPSDLQLTCEWNAENCGKVIAVSGNNLSKAHCKIELFQRRTCPSVIQLTANVSSRLAGIDIRTRKLINYQSDVWGVPSYINITLTDKDNTAFIPIKPRKDDIIVEKPPGLNLEFPEEGGLKIIKTKYFAKESDSIFLEYTGEGPAKGERVQIDVNKGDYWSNSLNARSGWAEKFLFIFSIIFTVACALYSAYMLGQSGNLPPLSPYRQKQD